MPDSFLRSHVSDSLSRRDLLKMGAAAMAGTAGLDWSQSELEAADSKRPQVAGIFTQFFYVINI